MIRMIISVSRNTDHDCSQSCEAYNAFWNTADILNAFIASGKLIVH